MVHAPITGPNPAALPFANKPDKAEMSSSMTDMVLDQLMADRDLMMRIDNLYSAIFGPAPEPTPGEVYKNPEGMYWRIKRNCEDQAEIRARANHQLNQLITML